jgi:hypothetical protein
VTHRPTRDIRFENQNKTILKYNLYKLLNNMNKITKKTNKWILPITILLAVIILSSFYYTSNSNKQESIEKIQILKIEEDKRIEQAKINKLEDCLDKIEEEFAPKRDDLMRWHNETCIAEGGTKNECLKIFLKAIEDDKIEKQESIEKCYERWNK